MRSDHGGDVRALIDASVNLNPFGPPAELDAVFARVREIAARYPEVGAESARDAWAVELGVGRDRLLVGNGASELIALAVRAIAPRRVVVPQPCYSEYESAAEAAGVPVVGAPFRLDDALGTWSTPMAELGLAAGDLLMLANPSNPTGHLTDPAEIVALAAASGADVLVDESFLPFLGDADRLSLARDAHRGLSVVTSLTKVFCVPGLRLGLFVGAPDLAAAMHALRDPWSVNGVAAEAALALVGQRAYLARTRAWLAAERPRLASALASIPGVRVTGGVAPYVLAELPAGESAARVCRALAARGLAVLDASTFAGLSERWVRVGVRSARENARIVDAIADALASAARELAPSAEVQP
jgi:histidinol-phosphate/aromatic aminotransferase/cobyric acid decarboxylase-like protein